jgi:hypothetical protein
MVLTYLMVAMATIGSMLALVMVIFSTVATEMTLYLVLVANHEGW